MMKKGIIIVLCFISVQTFAQWKSFYPEKNQKQKDRNKIEKIKQRLGLDEKDDFLFNTYLLSI